MLWGEPPLKSFLAQEFKESWEKTDILDGPVGPIEVVVHDFPLSFNKKFMHFEEPSLLFWGAKGKLEGI